MRKALIYWFAFLLILLAMTSCDIQKAANKSKTDTDLTEQIKTTTYRKGDTVTYEVPNVRLKDTTIYTYSRQGTTLKTVYDQSGNVSAIDCYSAAIAETQEINRRLLETIKEKEKTKTEDFDSSFVIYIMVGLVVMFLIFIVALFIYLKSKTAVV